MARILLERTAKFLSGLALLVMISGQGYAQIPIDGGCLLGESNAVHAVSAADAEARIRGYARRYTESYSAYKAQEREVRSKARSYMTLDKWSRQDLLEFTRYQRELLYISIGGQAALGKITVAEIPGYIDAVDRKINDIEIELGCAQSAPAG